MMIRWDRAYSVCLFFSTAAFSFPMKAGVGGRGSGMVTGYIQQSLPLLSISGLQLNWEFVPNCKQLWPVICSILLFPVSSIKPSRHRFLGSLVYHHPQPNPHPPSRSEKQAAHLNNDQTAQNWKCFQDRQIRSTAAITATSKFNQAVTNTKNIQIFKQVTTKL